MAMRRFTPDPMALYLTDNGRALCGRHLGASATYTGRDISGQLIERVTAADAAAAHKKYGVTFCCESCGLTPKE